MSVVRINAITVPPERAEEFEEFELLRPTDGRDQYLVYTRWASEDAFMAWVNSRAFQHGHQQHEGQGPVGTASELWSYEVIQQEAAAGAEA